MEESIFLTKYATKVYVLNRSETFRASKIMFDRASKNEKIEVLTNKVVEEVLGEEKVRALKLKDTKTGESSELELQGMFLAIGHIPVTDIFDVEKDDLGYVVHKENTMTNIPGVFAAGDCVDRRYRQAVTAAGMGCASAIDASRWLEEQE